MTASQKLARFDVLTVGNAIVDIIARAEDDFLVTNEITKGAMNLIDAERAETLYGAMGPAVETSGGSAGNTAAGIASLGGRAAYLGKVADDHLGGIFTHDIRAIGCTFQAAPLKGGLPTARSMIFVTPDGQRSMNTFLGACTELSPADVDANLVADATITYFEGYLWDAPNAKAAIREAARLAHEAGRKTAMTLSDSFCVDRFRDEFLALMRNGEIDILFANDSEAKVLYQTSDLYSALDALAKDVPLAVVTRSEDGSSVVKGDTLIHVNAMEIDKLEDTTGAGDLYAAGFLHGLTSGRSLEDCAKIGSLAAAEVIQHIGPRPQVELKRLLEQSGI
jgi:sugar/nucleoside kinase (ribokinase family)